MAGLFTEKRSKRASNRREGYGQGAKYIVVFVDN
jgi:hypothetical protein